MIFSDNDRAIMMAAVDGFSPNDTDMDPGDPEVGPRPYISPGFETTLMWLLDDLFGWVETGRKGILDYFSPYPQPEVTRGMNTMGALDEFDFRYDKYYEKMVRS